MRQVTAQHITFLIIRVYKDAGSPSPALSTDLGRAERIHSSPFSLLRTSRARYHFFPPKVATGHVQVV